MDDTPLDRRRLLATALAGGFLPLTAGCSESAEPEPGLRNALLWAVAWKQTAAEYRALCYQAYNVAQRLVEQALQEGRARPPAVITDMDDTVLHAGSYWGHLVERNRDFFDDAIWDEWVPENLVTAVPGSLEFLRFCEKSGVEVFYVTSRDQGEQSDAFALQHLKHLQFPYADAAHLTVLRDTSDKSSARREIASRFDVLLHIGDNLNDYKRDYYVSDIDERLRLVDRDRSDYGQHFIVLPNPTDGHWVRAIFGESEPAATDQNRRKLRDAAMRNTWNGREA